MDGDRPITQRKDDRLGFSPIAEQLALAIIAHSAREGLVFGIQGTWGSGKSSLINLTIEALKTHGDAAPEIIAFSPWLVGDRDELLLSLFNELADAAVKIDPIETAVTERGFRIWQLKRNARLRKRLGKKQKRLETLLGLLASWRGQRAHLAFLLASWSEPHWSAAARL